MKPVGLQLYTLRRPFGEAEGRDPFTPDLEE